MRYLWPLLVLTAACGSSPTGPSPTPPPLPITYPIAGTVTATNGGQPLAGATIATDGGSATTDGAGHYALTSSVPAPRFTLTGPGLVPRTGTLHGDIDAFGPGFDLGYFRQLARNGFDQPSNLQPIAHWTAPQNIYIRTVDAAGAPISAATIEMVSRVVREAVPAWTNGAYSVATLETGADTARDFQAGWITVRWVNVSDGFCGRSTVGLTGGYVELHYGSVSCTCNGWQTRPRTVKHEIGHAIGLYHSGDPSDLMYALQSTCDAQPSAREREYAAYLYRRPVGSTDEDHDPH